MATFSYNREHEGIHCSLFSFSRAIFCEEACRDYLIYIFCRKKNQETNNRVEFNRYVHTERCQKINQTTSKTMESAIKVKESFLKVRWSSLGMSFTKVIKQLS